VADIVDPATRSRMMSGIRGSNTGIEMAVRRALHRRGLRYRLHSTAIPGRPDLVFAGHRATVFVHGCFWHGHDCRLFRLPTTKVQFWKEKFERNRARDRQVRALLAASGWRQMVIWECALRGQPPAVIEEVARKIGVWLTSTVQFAELRGP